MYIHSVYQSSDQNNNINSSSSSNCTLQKYNFYSFYRTKDIVTKYLHNIKRNK